MADFKKAWEITSRNEGGYVNNSKDRGGETYRGVSIVHWPDWEGWPVVHTAIQELRIESTLDAGKEIWLGITEILSGNENLDALVQEFYKKNFWDVLDLDRESEQRLANDSFDTAVNMGVGEAKKIIRETKGTDNA